MKLEKRLSINNEIVFLSGSFEHISVYSVVNEPSKVYLCVGDESLIGLNLSQNKGIAYLKDIYKTETLDKLIKEILAK